MTDIIISGCFGTMGRTIAEKASVVPDMRITAGVDISKRDDEYRFPVYEGFYKLPEFQNCVIIDFSHPSVLSGMIDYALKYSLPVVICTTGMSEDNVELIKRASSRIPIFYSGNMSLGINLLISLAKTAVKALGNGFDIEIIEKHHNQKIDAPSGTALMIADAVKAEKPESYYVYDRHSERKKRDKAEVGIHSIRGGTIVGEHEIVFAGVDEVLSIKHTAQSKAVFAMGAINAARFIIGKAPGMYDMNDLIAQE